MDVLAVILFGFLLFMIFNIKSSFNHRMEELIDEIKLLKQQLSKPPIEDSLTEKPIPPASEIPTPPATTTPTKETWESGFKIITDPASVDPVPETLAQQKQEEISLSKRVEKITIKEPITHEKPQYIPAPPQPGFFEKHPDIEKFIGENLINKIGIAILVLAIGFFVKYAIDQDWIGKGSRVAIGILCGAILIGLGHRLRINYKAFSSVLVGGGLAVFYFTIALGYHQFQLFSQPVSFIILVVVTVFAVVLSLLYNRQELAIISLVGGFATPFLVSNGSGDYKTLFSYLLILNTGLLFIAYHKAWRILNLLAFAGTVILYASWLFMLPFDAPVTTYSNGFLFAIAFYLLFFLINIANNIKENKKFIALDFGILLLNTSLFFGAGLYLLNHMDAPQYRGLFSASMGLFNLAASFILFRKQKTDRNILYLLIGLTLSFISLTAPIQLHGNYITLFWASETVLLYWLFQKSKIGIIAYSSMIVWAAMLISLLVDWAQLYESSTSPLPILTNKGFITGLCAAIATYLLFLLKKKDAPETGVGFVTANHYRLTGVVLLFVAGLLEINHQFVYYFPGTSINIQYLLLYIYAFVILFTSVSAKFPSLEISPGIALFLQVTTLGLYVCAVQENFSMLYRLLTENKDHYQYVAHWIGVLLVAVNFLRIAKWIKTKYTGDTTIISWLMAAWAVLLLSAETFLISNAIFYNGSNNWYSISNVFIKTGLPILWGLCSFCLMWMGMHYKFRTFRIISLSLFALTLIKLFAYDISNIPIGGKIAAFFCLGILLLVVSFMYQRLKRIIIEDEKKNSE